MKNIISAQKPVLIGRKAAPLPIPEWEGKEYLDKGKILELIPEKQLTIAHWSSRTGKPATPENYFSHTYKLEEIGDATRIIITQEDVYPTEESRANAWQHWNVVMKGLEKLLAGQAEK